jgi:hypothetical protein
MTADHDWAGFYGALCEHGPRILRGIDEDDREIIRLMAGTDAFWSEGLPDLLAEEGDRRAAVLAALDRWRDNVLEALGADFGLELDPAVVAVDREDPLVDRLVAAAFP